MPKETFETLLATGSKAYTTNNHAVAIKAFQEAFQIAQTPKRRMQALDMHIAPMTKLKDLDRAMTIAKDMIRLNRTSPQGYLRAGQIDRLRKQPEAAAKWYRQGLKHVSSHDSEYRQLEAGLTKSNDLEISLRVRSCPRDPFTTFPVEVAEIILQYLTYRDMSGALRVSKGWNNFLCKSKLMTTTLDFSGGEQGRRTEVTLVALKAALRRLTQYPKIARMNHLSITATADLNNRLPHWFRRDTLETFTLDSTIPDSTLSILLTSTALQELKILSDNGLALGLVLTHCRALKRLTLITSPKAARNASWINGLYIDHPELQSLHYHNRDPETFFSIGRITSPNLKHLSLRRVGSSDLKLDQLLNLRSVAFDDCAISGHITLPVSLQHLLFGAAKYIIRTLTTKLPNLVSLAMYDNARGHAPTEMFLDPKPFLESVDISSDLVNDHSAIRLAALPRLRKVAISDNSKITGVFVKTLLEQTQGQIERIELQRCTNVGTDTAEWARQMHKGTVVN
ncbi:uncharacterized protein AB675_3726, partial [Cyphellophora attinorum]